MALSNKEYWEKRSLKRLTEAEKASIPYIRHVRKVYEDSARSIVSSVKKMYQTYYRRQKSDTTGRFDTTKLQEIAPSGDIRRLLADMKAAGLSTRLPDYYKGRITRAKLLEAQMWAEIQKAAKNEQELSTKSYKNTINSSYYRSIYDYSKLTNTDQAFSKLNDRSINRILNSKLAGDDYSSRIWKSSDKLAGSIKNIMGKAIATGQPLEKTTRDVLQRFDVKKYEAERLIRTETNYFENYAELESYEEMEIDHFIFMATLDGRTSEICREMDGKIFKVKDAKQGDNVPPLHPYCRSTIAPYFNKEYLPKERRARNPREDSKAQAVKFQSFQSWVDKNGISGTDGNKTQTQYDKRKARHLYKDISREELSKMTHKNIEKYVFSKKDEVSDNEIISALIVERELNIKLKHFPRVDIPKKVKTPDFGSSDSNILVEIKEPKSYKNGIEDCLRKSRKQILTFHESLDCGVTVINIDSIKDMQDDNQIIKEIKRRAKEIKLQNIFIIKHGQLLYKETNKKISASAPE